MEIYTLTDHETEETKVFETLQEIAERLNISKSNAHNLATQNRLYEKRFEVNKWVSESKATPGNIPREMWEDWDRVITKFKLPPEDNYYRDRLKELSNHIRFYAQETEKSIDEVVAMIESKLRLN